MTTKTMEYRYLGNSGIKISNICLGTMTFGMKRDPPGHSCDEALSQHIIERYVQMGGNFLDTANYYNKGLSEEIIGRWIERRERESIVIATKAGLSMGLRNNRNNMGLSRRHITDSIDRSLERLHTDHIDLFQTHIWDESTRVEETLRTLDDLVRCGKTRYVGACNLTGWQLQKLVSTSKNLGLNPLITLQQQYSLLHRYSEIEPFQVCKMEGIGVLPWSPLRGGMLSGKIKRNVAPTEGRVAWVSKDERSRENPANPAFKSLDDNMFDVVEAAEKIARKKGKSTAQVAVRWLLQKDVVSSVIIGATKLTQLEDNMGAAHGWNLTTEEMQDLDNISDVKISYPYDMINGFNRNRKNPFSPSQHVLNFKPKL